MTSKVLFEASIWTIQPMVVFCLLLPMWIFLICLSIDFRKKTMFFKNNWKTFLKIQLVFLIPLFLVYLMELFPYHMGWYETVEGDVENFNGPSPSERMNRGLSESFCISGIEFKYSDGIVSCGYHKMQINHGIIYPDLKDIRIIYLPRNRNIIMRIESLSDNVVQMDYPTAG